MYQFTGISGKPHHQHNNMGYFFLCLIILFSSACKKSSKEAENNSPTTIEQIAPTLRTEKVQFDTDDPAVWYNSKDPSKSLIVGTDKEIGGGLYVFNLEGKIQRDLTVYGLDYPNNVDIEYNFPLKDKTLIDIVITVERPKGLIRIFSVPEFQPLDGGGIPAFASETDTNWRKPMGIAIYKRPKDGAFFLIVSRKEGPVTGDYLWQYQIVPGDTTPVSLVPVRKFGQFSGAPSEIEAIMVDDMLGYIYYSDEAYGIRKYYADPDMGNDELCVFGQNDFTEDREGIALWLTSDRDGYIVISNQQDHSFNVYPRNPENHLHQQIGNWRLSTVETDGLEIIAKPLGKQFPKGVLVAMSEDSTFHYYDLRKLKLK